MYHSTFEMVKYHCSRFFSKLFVVGLTLAVFAYIVINFN